MSFRKNAKRIKSLYKNINNFTIATVEMNYGDHLLNECKLILDGSFKMVVIQYEGMSKIIPSDYNNFTINKNNRTITISNFGRNTLKNDLLFEFIGTIFIKSARVYKWGEQSRLATIRNSINSGTLSTNDNLIDSDFLISKKEQTPKTLDERQGEERKTILIEEKLRRRNGI